MADIRNSVTIQVHENEWDNADLITLLYKLSGIDQVVIEKQPQFGDGIFWPMNGLTAELFVHAAEFDWIPNYYGNSGDAKLWLGEDPLTKDNYRTAVYVGEGEEMVFDHWEYPDFNLLTDQAPIVEIEEEF